jgi:Na+/H+ antiporter NhaD/arsenite permease-like protein
LGHHEHNNNWHHLVFLSAVIDNLTTALVMCAIILAVGADNSRFIALSCINIVVAANAGGAWSAFGDITSLMLWQAGFLGCFQFLDLLVPPAVNFVVPAAAMHFAIPAGRDLRMRHRALSL